MSHADRRAFNQQPEIIDLRRRYAIALTDSNHVGAASLGLEIDGLWNRNKMEGVIHRYSIGLVGDHRLEIPSGSQFMSMGVRAQDDIPGLPEVARISFWYEVDPTTQEVKSYQFYVKGTGHPTQDLPDEVVFLGTVCTGGNLYWHVWVAEEVTP